MAADPENPTQQPDRGALAAPTSELDLLESGRRSARARRHQTVAAPPVRLGMLEQGGLAPAILAIVERGVRRRPGLAASIAAEIQLEFDEGYPPVRVVFGDRLVLVEDGPAAAADLRVEGSLADLVSLMATPLVGGLPNPVNARGRAALGMVALGRLRIEGRLGLMRQLIRVIRV